MEPGSDALAVGGYLGPKGLGVGKRLLRPQGLDEVQRHLLAVEFPTEVRSL